MNKKITKLKLERFSINILDKDIHFIENIARQNGITKSWVYRAILHALIKKFPDNLPDKYEVKRPIKFKQDFRQTVICFYGDKNKWMCLTRIWNIELGPLIRFGLNMYYRGELKLDFETLKSVKETKIATPGKRTRTKRKTQKNRYTYHYQNNTIGYDIQEFWQKNTRNNILLMEWGLNNRKYPLKLK